MDSFAPCFTPAPHWFDAVPGDHYTILRPPHVDALAARVRAALDAVG